MDLTRKVTYRGFALNSLAFDEIDQHMVGCEITQVEYGRVIGEGYTEKRAMGEGRDASDIYLDQRLISLVGNVYGRNRPEALDLHRDLSDVLTPSDAYEQDRGQKGYLPLDFYSPTLNIEAEPKGFPTGVIHQVMYARPLATPSARFASDGQGGVDNEALAIPWQAQLSCRDPRILGMNFNQTNMTSSDRTGSGTIRNRGNRPAVIEVYLTIPANINGNNGNGRLELWIEGAFRLWITLPKTDSPMILQYNSDAKVCEYGASTHGQLRMNYLDFRKNTTHGFVQPGGARSYKWTVVGTKHLVSPSYFRFRDTWA